MVVNGFVALQNAAHHLNVFTCASERLGVWLAVPAFHYLWARGAKTKNETTIAEMVDGHRSHSGS